MSFVLISPNIYNCALCNTRCDGKSVAQFDFEKDVAFSERIEQDVISYFNKVYYSLHSYKTTKEGYPDIEIVNKDNVEYPVAFVEIKGQARTFMSVARILPNSKLQASETLALNLSDLERYFAIDAIENKPLFIVWCLLSRPCIVGNSSKFFYQSIKVLKQIREADTNNTRRFRRASGKGDIVNGIHKGVVVNYHFSINELIEGLPQF
jgi:hypothetical protein